MPDGETESSMTLWVTCKHGEPQGHWISGKTTGCPGGRPATPEDVIEALGGEKVWMCFSTLMPRCKADHPDPMGLGGHDSCQFVYLTPALDQEKHGA